MFGFPKEEDTQVLHHFPGSTGRFSGDAVIPDVYRRGGGIPYRHQYSLGEGELQAIVWCRDEEELQDQFDILSLYCLWREESMWKMWSLVR